MLGRPLSLPAMPITSLCMGCLLFFLPLRPLRRVLHPPLTTPREPAPGPSAERVAPRHVPGPVALAEPLLPLRRRPVRPGLRRHPALEPFLDPVVTHGRRRVQAVADIGLRETGDQRPPG